MLALEGVVIAYEDWRLTADFTIAAGSSTAIIGPSGAGKSTLLDTIAGFIEPAEGRVLWEGRDLTPLPPAARPVTLLFQDHNLFAHLSVAQNVGLGLRPDLRLDAGERARVAAALAETGLAGKEGRRPGELSGGERSRVALARALLQEPAAPAARRAVCGAGAGTSGGDARPRGAHPGRAGGDALDGQPRAGGCPADCRSGGAGGRGAGRGAGGDGGALRRPAAGAQGLSGCITMIHLLSC